MLDLNSRNLGWIEACVRFAGRFGPREKMCYRQIFNISAPTVSRHQMFVADCLEQAAVKPLFERDSHGQIIGGKLTLLQDANLTKSPVFAQLPSLERWLEDTFEHRHYYAAAIEHAKPAPRIIRPIVNALEDSEPILITYYSRNTKATRQLSPHALVNVANRIHLRGYDHSKNRFADFVLARIKKVNSVTTPSAPYIGNEGDVEWHEFVEILIEESTTDTAVTQGLRMEFSLNDHGQRIMRVRRAIARYLTDIEDPQFKSPVNVTLHGSD